MGSVHGATYLGINFLWVTLTPKCCGVMWVVPWDKSRCEYAGLDTHGNKEKGEILTKGTILYTNIHFSVVIYTLQRSYLFIKSMMLCVLHALHYTIYSKGMWFRLVQEKHPYWVQSWEKCSFYMVLYMQTDRLHTCPRLFSDLLCLCFVTGFLLIPFCLCRYHGYFLEQFVRTFYLERVMILKGGSNVENCLLLFYCEACFFFFFFFVQYYFIKFRF